MREPQRIDRVLELLKVYWKQNPDLRLGQIIGNGTPRKKIEVQDDMGGYMTEGPGDPYYVEDDIIEKYLREQLKKR